MTLYTRNLDFGHSYVNGTGVSTPFNSIFNQVDTLVGHFSGIDDIPTADSPVFTENFAAANGLITTLAGRAAYRTPGSVWNINSNQAQLATNSGGNNVLVADFGCADAVVDLTLAAPVQFMGVCLRYVDDNNYLYLKLFPSFVSAELWQRVAGVDTRIGTASFVSTAHVAVCMRGTTITIQSSNSGAQNFNAKFISVTAGQTATKHGLFATSGVGSTVRWDVITVTDTSLTGSGLATQLGMWSVRNGCYQLVGQERKGAHFLVKDTGWSDGYVAERIGLDTAAVGLVFRYVDDNNYCYSQCSAPAFVSLHKVVGGVDTSLGTFLCPIATNAIVRIDFFGTRVRMSTGSGYANVTEQTISDAIFLTATKHGTWATTNTLATVLNQRAWSRIYTSHVDFDGVGATTLAGHLVSGRVGGYVRVLQLLPRLTATDMLVYMWGINDPPGLGSDSRALKGWAGSLRTVLSRALATTVHGDGDPSVVYSGTGWTTQVGTDRNSGAGWHETSTQGDSLTITVTTAGATIALGSLNIHDDLGATATVRLDGIVVATIDTNGVWTGHTYYGGSCTRISVPFGTHTITITVDSVNGSFVFDYWQEEAVTPNIPRVLMCNIAKLPSYTAYTSLGAHVDDNAVQAYNDQTDAVCAEFPFPASRVVDMDAALAKNSAYFYTDMVHPNDAGALIIANLLIAESAIMPSETAPTPHPTGRKWTFEDPVSAETFTFTYNPTDGGEPGVKKIVTTQTTGVDRLPIIIAVTTSPGEIALKGTLLSQSDRDALLAWVDKDRQFLWTNDLDEQRWIYIDKFSATRKHAVSHAYRADYDLHAIVLANSSPPPTAIGSFGYSGGYSGGY